MQTSTTPVRSRRSHLNAFGLFLIPIVLLLGVIALFLSTSGAGLNARPAAPIEQVQFERTILRPGVITLQLRNTSPQDLTIGQIAINDAFWPFTAVPAATIPRLESAVVTLDYPWVKGEAYEITIFSSNAIPFHTAIPVAAATATSSPATLWSFTLIGIYVGVVPIILGMFWFPALKRLGHQSM